MGIRAPSEWDQELTYWVEWMVAHRKILTNWQGRLEGLVSRHWPEATRVLKLSSVTLLRALEHYGDPKAWRRTPMPRSSWAAGVEPFLAPEKAERLVAEANSSVGVRVGEWQRRQIQEYAREALAARQQAERRGTAVVRAGRGNKVLEAQGKAVGVPTACVLWTSTGDPRNYHAAAAYRKAMGLNLKERSSGTYQGQIRISKRGSARRGNGFISPRCGWCNIAECVPGTKPRRPAMKTMPDG